MCIYIFPFANTVLVYVSGNAKHTKFMCQQKPFVSVISGLVSSLTRLKITIPYIANFIIRISNQKAKQAAPTFLHEEAETYKRTLNN